ncbi:MAG: sulfate reduction electron transfer complex DsrMKJOP subunit DsrO [Isosphaeraceae bacterium]
MDENRRGFLKEVGYAAAAAGCGLPLLAAAWNAGEESSQGASASTEQLGLVIDIKKCLRDEVRSACSTACHRAHNVPQVADDPKNEIKWIWTETYEHAFPDQAHSRVADSLKDKPVLVLCNHCTNPPCVRVCPTEATWKRAQDGIVMMDMHRCIGCRYCVAACPFGARSFNWRDPRPYLDPANPSTYPSRTKGVVEKCNFCEDRLREGLEPACVEAARGVAGGEGALTFGDLSDPNSQVSRLLREKVTICRRPSLGTAPNVFYIV